LLQQQVEATLIAISSILRLCCHLNEMKTKLKKGNENDGAWGNSSQGGTSWQRFEEDSLTRIPVHKVNFLSCKLCFAWWEWANMNSSCNGLSLGFSK